MFKRGGGLKRTAIVRRMGPDRQLASGWVVEAKKLFRYALSATTST